MPSERPLLETLNQFKLIHGDTYDYSLITDYVGNNEKIPIICKIHGQFNQLVRSHLYGRGCIKCYADDRRFTQADFIRLSNEKHNNQYSYLKTNYISDKTKVIITCPNHGDWEVRAGSHSRDGHGCPYCKSSKGELRIRKWLETKQIDFKQEYSFPECKNLSTNRKFKFDFFLPKLNTVVEFHGEHHYGVVSFGSTKPKSYLEQRFVNYQYKDVFKRNYCFNNNINFLCIPYTEIDNMETILANHFHEQGSLSL